jgi:GLPGLI family protein
MLNFLFKIFLVANFILVSNSFGQFITSGKIIYERKTNLLKLVPYLPDFLKDIAKEKKYNIDEFELSFNEHGSAFIPKPPATQSSGYADMLTTENTIYSDHQTHDRLTILDVMGNKVYIKDTVNKIPWTMTDNTRKLAGYECKMAIYRKDDSTRMYAWYSEELIPSVGPETFSGLPGTILGMALEDGSVVYFAKSVEIATIDDKVFKYDAGKAKIMTKKSFETELIKQMGNNPMAKGMIMSFFRWY